MFIKIKDINERVHLSNANSTQEIVVSPNNLITFYINDRSFVSTENLEDILEQIEKVTTATVTIDSEGGSIKCQYPKN